MDSMSTYASPIFRSHFIHLYICLSYFCPFSGKKVFFFVFFFNTGDLSTLATPLLNCGVNGEILKPQSKDMVTRAQAPWG